MIEGVNELVLSLKCSGSEDSDRDTLQYGDKSGVCVRVVLSKRHKKRLKKSETHFSTHLEVDRCRY